MAKRKKEKEYDPNLPKPRLEWRDGKPFVTDGWIMGSQIRIKIKRGILFALFLINMIFICLY